MFCLFLLNFMKVGNKYTFIHSFRIHIKPVALQVNPPKYFPKFNSSIQVRYLFSGLFIGGLVFTIQPRVS